MLILWHKIKMGGSLFNAVIKCCDEDHYLLQNSAGGAEIRNGLQTDSFFEIKYHENANISIKSIHGNGKYLSAKSDGSLLFNSKDVNQTELFRVCGYN